MRTPHIASPDVKVDDKNRQIKMYFHGLEGLSHQVTRMALSGDAINFVAQPQILAKPYLRIFEYENETYAIAMPSQIYRYNESAQIFGEGPLLFERDMRRCAVIVRNSKLNVFWTRVGDVLESILFSTIDLNREWEQWTNEGDFEVLRPERDWEGASEPLLPSQRSSGYGPLNQLKDPAAFEDGDFAYLFYAAAGESGIKVVQIDW